LYWKTLRWAENKERRKQAIRKQLKTRERTIGVERYRLTILSAATNMEQG